MGANSENGANQYLLPKHISFLLGLISSFLSTVHQIHLLLTLIASKDVFKGL